MIGKQTVFVLFFYDILYAIQQTLKSVFLENVLVIADLVGYHIVDNSHSREKFRQIKKNFVF